MKPILLRPLALAATLLAAAAPSAATPVVSGELKLWHKVTLTLDGPAAKETDTAPNPFLDFNFTVTFTHESGQRILVVPGYFAADGDAANTGATAGNRWRAHLAPDREGRWAYTVSFTRGPRAALGEPGEAVAPCHGLTGSFVVGPTDKTGRDFRSRGRLDFVGERYLRFAGSGEYFLKCGADAPENFLSYSDFDGDFKTDGHKDNLVKTWQAHLADWQPGDPTWQDGKGKGIVGAINYLAGKGLNAVSFLTMNIVGDDQNVFPYLSYEDYTHFDVSRLDQWEIVFGHAQRRGLFLHFKTQEAENQGLLDGGEVGPQRQLYYRELIARFGHHLALNWNMGEEIGRWQKKPITPEQTTPQRLAMADYFFRHDPYQHHRVLHNGAPFDDVVGPQSSYTGASYQGSYSSAHANVLRWLRKAEQAGKVWAVANDEQNPADMGVPPDPGYRGFNGEAVQHGKPYTLHDVRKATLWGVLLAGGWGVEYYFGYKLPENDLECQDYRSRDASWSYCRIALEFFRDAAIPFSEMRNADELVGNPKADNTAYCFAKAGALYLVFLPNGGTATLDLTGARGDFSVKWLNPREGGALREGAVKAIAGGGKVVLGPPPADPSEDWLAIVRK